jgi:hypothetical protein
VLKLLVSEGARVGGNLLAVDAQGEIHLIEKTRDRVGGDGNVDLLEDLGDLLRRLAGPLQSGNGISGGVVF